MFPIFCFSSEVLDNLSRSPCMSYWCDCSISGAVRTSTFSHVTYRMVDPSFFNDNSQNLLSPPLRIYFCKDFRTRPIFSEYFSCGFYHNESGHLRYCFFNSFCNSEDSIRIYLRFSCRLHPRHISDYFGLHCIFHFFDSAIFFIIFFIRLCISM